MPTARGNLQAVSLSGLIYVIGGTTGSSSLTTVEVYDPVANTWSPGTPLPTPEFGAGAVVANGAIYVISDYGETGDVPFVYQFTPASAGR
jgi:Kelch motif